MSDTKPGDTGGASKLDAGAEPKLGTGAEPKLSDTAEEARALAREGLDEMHGGNKEEGKFLIDEARSLDKKAADEIVSKDK